MLRPPLTSIHLLTSLALIACAGPRAAAPDHKSAEVESTEIVSDPGSEVSTEQAGESVEDLATQVALAPNGVTAPANAVVLSNTKPQVKPKTKQKPLVPRYSSHNSFLAKRLKASKRLEKAHFRDEMQSRTENYPRRFKSNLPSFPVYRKNNPRPKRRVTANAPIGLPQSNAHGPHTIQIEGANLVVRDTASPQGENPIVHSLAHGIALQAGRQHPHQASTPTIAQATVLVVGDRVILIGGHPNVRSFLIDKAGKLTESRGFLIPSSILSVSGDEVQFVIPPRGPSYSNPTHVPVLLPQIQISDSMHNASYVPLIDGARTYGPPFKAQPFTPFNLLVVGQCSFSIADHKKACVASASEVFPGALFGSTPRQNSEALIYEVSNGEYHFPWTGAAPYILVPDSP